ncbi:MAG: hypothetical protein IJX84_05185 [Clostridia bacterium]|nr:hypothetical protein [Clostridia bacterium]
MSVLSKVTELLPQLADILVYAAIAVVTLIGVIKCLLPLWNTTHALRRAIRRLQHDAGNTTSEKPVWQESRFMGRRLRGYWLRFLQNAEQLDRRGLPCNVEDYINDDTVAHGPGNANLAEMIPSMLTSLGILGTFMGMVRGIGGLDFSNSDAIIEGVPTLLAGMQFAFGTSVAGVSCSIVFSMLNRIAQGSSYRAIDDFVESFTQLAMQRPLDNDVQLICQNQDSNHMLSTLTDTLPGQLAKSMEVSVSRAMQPVARSMDDFLVGATRAQVDGVGRIVNNFVNQMNTSLNHQFLELGRTLTEINQNQQLSLERMDQSMETASAIVGDVTRLHGVSQEVMAHFEHYVSELNTARTRDERFEQSSADLLEKMRQASEQQSASLLRLKAYQDELSAALDQFRTQSRETMTTMQRGNDNTNDHLAAVGKTMQESSTQLSQSYQGFVQNVVEGLSRALGMFDENMNSLVATLTEKVDSVTTAGTDGKTAAQLSEIQRMLTSMQASLKQAANSLDAKEA